MRSIEQPLTLYACMTRVGCPTTAVTMRIVTVLHTVLQVVLAYSGGLDTSVILKWLSGQGFEVIW